MVTTTQRALIDVRCTGHGLVVTDANDATDDLVGVHRGSLVGSAWGSQFASVDRSWLVDRSGEVIDRVRDSWSGDLELLHRAGSWVHVVVTRPTGALCSRISVELAELEGPSIPVQPSRRPTDVDRAKDEFITAVSHELRTPLTSILGYTDVLLDGSVEDLTPIQHRMVERVERNSLRLLKLVENLLTLSDIQAGTFCMVRQDVDLHGVVGDSLARVATAIKAAELDLTYDLDGRPSDVLGDETQLSRVITSLLDNAIMFTPGGGHIRVTLRQEGEHTVLEVADTGVGIPEPEQPLLFDRFARARDARTRETQGLGLGLTVVDSIVRSHGGRVNLSSTPGVGTVVTVRLPLARRPVDANPSTRDAARRQSPGRGPRILSTTPSGSG